MHPEEVHAEHELTVIPVIPNRPVSSRISIDAMVRLNMLAGDVVPTSLDKRMRL
jgi:hypothetical protein